MTLLPEHIERQTFKERFKGYDMDEVDRFLDRVVESMRELTAEREALRRRAEDARRGGEEDDLLRRTLVTAQRTADQLVSEARAEADRLRRQARVEAEEEMARLRAEADELVRAIEDLTRCRDSYRERLIAVISEHQAWLERATALPDLPADADTAVRTIHGADGEPAATAGWSADQEAADPWGTPEADVSGAGPRSVLADASLDEAHVGER